MKDSIAKELQQYKYALPPQLVRRVPVEPRDEARILIYEINADKISLDYFKNVAQYIPSGSALIMNTTRVQPSRLHLYRRTGGRVEVFVLLNEWQGSNDAIPVLMNRATEVGEELCTDDQEFTFTVLSDNAGVRRVLLQSEIPLIELLNHYGETPIPPYLSGGGLSEEALRMRYQSVLAEEGNSVAAPTASLHFTSRVLDTLAAHNVGVLPVNLGVGLGTFADVTQAMWDAKKLHTEPITIPNDTAEGLQKLKQENRLCIPVGTTALRAIESLDRLTLEGGNYVGETDIFIQPGDQFHYATGLMTNFHLPQTSLMCLVDAFLVANHSPRTVLDLYQVAIAEEFSFYSFGDSMLILP